MRNPIALLLALGAIAVAKAQTAPVASTANDAKAKVRIPLDQPEPPKSAAPNKTMPKNSAPKEAKKTDAAPSKTEPKKKEDEIGKIDGITIPRGENRFLGIEIVGGNFKLTFYNDKKKPVPPDVARAVLRWDPKYKLGMERVVLTPGGPHSLTAEKFVRPPYNFKLTIVLLGESADGDGAEPGGETHVIDFRQ